MTEEGSQEKDRQRFKIRIRNYDEPIDVTSNVKIVSDSHLHHSGLSAKDIDRLHFMKWLLDNGRY